MLRFPDIAAGGDDRHSCKHATTGAKARSHPPAAGSPVCRSLLSQHFQHLTPAIRLFRYRSVDFALGVVGTGFAGLEFVNFPESCLESFNDLIRRFQAEGKVQANGICKVDRFILRRINPGLGREPFEIRPLDRYEVDPACLQHLDVQDALRVERCVLFRNAVPLGEDGAGAVDDDTNLVLMQVFGILDVEVPILLADEVGFKLQDWSGPLEQLFPLRRTARREEDRVRFKLRLSIGPGLGEKHDVFAALFRADLF